MHYNGMRKTKLRYCNMKTRKIVTEQELKTLLSEMGYDEAKKEAPLWVVCA